MADKYSAFKELGKILYKGAKTVGPYVLAAEVYTKVFFKRTETDPFLLFKHDDYPKLIKERDTFISDGNQLVGYFYHYENYDTSKVIIFAHGYGNGHKRYLDLINEICLAGFVVFAYDVTSFDESGGKGIRSFPQGIIDLSNAINFVSKYSKYGRGDIYLIGHSMGGYSVGCNLKIFRDIKKAVIMSGFNQSSALIKDHGEEFIGEDAEKVIKYIDAYEEYYFKDYASYSVLEGLKESTGEVMIIHSKDDKTVGYRGSFEKYYREFAKNKRFTFISFISRGHGTVYDSDKGKKFFEETYTLYKKYLKDNPKATREEKEAYIASIRDYDKWLDMLDYDLVDKIVKFFKK